MCRVWAGKAGRWGQRPLQGAGEIWQLGFPWGKLSSEARLMRGTCLFSRAFPMSPVPLIRQPFGLPPSPGGKAQGARKRHLSIKNMSAAAALGGPQVAQTHPCLYPYQRAVDLLLKRESAPRLALRLFFGGLGDVSFPREKKHPPEGRTSRRATRQQSNGTTPQSEIILLCDAKSLKS